MVIELQVEYICTLYVINSFHYTKRDDITAGSPKIIERGLITHNMTNTGYVRVRKVCGGGY